MVATAKGVTSDVICLVLQLIVLVCNQFVEQAYCFFEFVLCQEDFCFFNIISPIMSIVVAAIGYKIKRVRISSMEFV